ncbi:MAG: L-threonylcarbamoyladenylate synthase [bacterium]|nr:L-threonylcarbamoyladenylate synthase [bacterium]
MQKISIDPANPDLKVVSTATRILEKGGLVICPTDTAYLLAADATNPSAIKKIFDIKGRSRGKPIHIVVADIEMAKKYAFLNQRSLALADKFLPGPLTIVLKKRDGLLPEILTGGKPTVGIRIPALAVNKLLARELGRPYTATSANRSGRKAPYSVEEVLVELDDKKIELVDLILDAGRLKRVSPSTIVDFTKKKPLILREGPVSVQQIEKIFSNEEEPKLN